MKKKIPKKNKIAGKWLKTKLKSQLNLAGIYSDPRHVTVWILYISILLTILADLGLAYYGINKIGYSIFISIVFTMVITPIIFGEMYFVCWITFYFYLDVRIFQRQQKVEEVLPDFLQLTSANIRAGMPIDQSLWYSIKPRFGVLAKEIETIAKETMSGEDLNISLKRFADKFDSLVLKRSISLLLAGMEAGGEIGELLDKIAMDIQESRLMRKEMASSVQSYVIFISFTTIAAAPLLFGLSLELLNIVKNLVGNMEFGSSATQGIGITPGTTAITSGDFKIFAYTMLTITSVISAMIIAIIQKGSIKAGLKYIPLFIIGSVTLFTVAHLLFSRLFSGIMI